MVKLMRKWGRCSGEGMELVMVVGMNDTTAAGEEDGKRNTGVFFCVMFRSTSSGARTSPLGCQGAPCFAQVKR